MLWKHSALIWRVTNWVRLAPFHHACNLAQLTTLPSQKLTDPFRSYSRIPPSLCDAHDARKNTSTLNFSFRAQNYIRFENRLCLLQRTIEILILSAIGVNLCPCKFRRGQTRWNDPLILEHWIQRSKNSTPPLGFLGRVLTRWHKDTAGFLVAMRGVKKGMLPLRAGENSSLSRSGMRWWRKLHKAVCWNEIRWNGTWPTGVTRGTTGYCKRGYGDIMVMIREHDGKRERVKLNEISIDIL